MRQLISKLILLTMVSMLLISCESLRNALPGVNNGEEGSAEQGENSAEDIPEGVAVIEGEAGTQDASGEQADGGTEVVLPQAGDAGSAQVDGAYPTGADGAYPAEGDGVQPQGEQTASDAYPAEGDGTQAQGEQPAGEAYPVEDGAAANSDNAAGDAGAAGAASASDLDAFDMALRSAISNRDFAQMNANMNDSFAIGWWQSEWVDLGAAEATTELQNRYLPDGANVTFEAADLAGLLGGQDPFAMLGPDVNVQRVLFSRGWMDGQGEAMVYVSQSADGSLTWDALLIAPEGFGDPTSSGGSNDIDSFDTALREAIVARNYDYLRDNMADPFVFGLWRSEGMALEPVLAAEQMRTNFLPLEGDVSFDAADLAALLDGQDPFLMFGPDANIQRVLFSRGWLGGAGEVMVFIGQAQDGTLNWHGMILAPVGFAAANPSPLVPTRLIFADGASSTMVDGTLTTGQVDKFAVRAAAGQWMSVDIASSNNDVHLAVTGVDSNDVLLAHEAGQINFSDTLALTQDYIISARADGAATSYSMVIEIQ